MKINIIIKSNDKYYDLTDLCQNEVLLTSTVNNAPSSLKFKIALNVLNNVNISFEEGSEVILYADGNGLFKGYIFQKQRTKEQQIDVLAYDQLRYLKNKDSFYFKNLTASEIIKNICSQFKINTGEIENTNYVIPILVEDNVTLWSIFERVLKLTETETNEGYIIYDDFGKLTLKNKKDFSIPIFFSSDDTSMIDFNLKTDIDSNTFNKVKLFKYNKNTKTYDIVANVESTDVSDWGVLQYTEVVEPEMNIAQAKEKAKMLLEAKAKVNNTLSIIDFGNINIRAGVTIGAKIKDGGDVIDSLFSVKECIHTFKNNEHTMKLELTKV